MLTQIIPSELCLKCDICCRFPEQESFLAPFFTEEEIQKASLYGLSIEFFKGEKSGKIGLIPFPDHVESPGHNGGCQCPCFDPVSHQCSIYEARPFDCQIYPFVLMRLDHQALPVGEPGFGGSGSEASGPLNINRQHEVVLGMDTKCPFIRDRVNSPEIYAFSSELALRLESSYQTLLLKNRGLIGPFQEDVIVLHSLRGLSS